MTLYQEKLKDPRWQKRRLEILQRDSWTCVGCAGTEKTLHVHHFWYEDNLDPWEYPDRCLVTLCESCHELVPSGFNLTRVQAQLSHCDKVAIDRSIVRSILQLAPKGDPFRSIAKEIVSSVPFYRIFLEHIESGAAPQ